ncbi:hypothetical protein J8L98_02220 [Pseudoalteromonas sp. MMG013]|uniref:hypothetical protein n=1 Tax=Pseudoalteromonas sp. MMG013 TaxID=2822687 RepID=UPI001B3875CA|nr:hypothetical protein [Pseudoalteromonas sp. MMG013]MBQ4860508.1 hypothetical protein [Pseudoalteromonas sp. MMG013]
MKRTFFYACSLLCLSDLSYARTAEHDVANLAVQTANQICQSPQSYGSNHKLEIQGDLKANLGGVLKKLAKLNGNANAQYVAEEWVGVNQVQLADAMRDSNSCKLTVFKMIMQSSVQSGWQEKNASDPKKGPRLIHTSGGASPMLYKPEIMGARVKGCNNVEANARVKLLGEYQNGITNFVKVQVLEGTCKGVIGWTNKDFYRL